MKQNTSLNPDEISHFAKDSAKWWDLDGPFAPLHRLNPTRMGYIRDQVVQHYNKDETHPALKGLSILDIGCGGGLVSESLARMGAKTTGLDADSIAISVAQDHAKSQGLNINYHNLTSEEYAEKHPKEKFDVVCALEIIEHVENPEYFVQTALGLLKPGGIIILSTLNRTIKSAVLGIFFAEYVLGWVPKGTHTHNKFIKPAELNVHLRNNGANISELMGMRYNPINQEFILDPNDLSINYFISAIKP